ncbi:tetratricopeptide repeat protein [uncultured Imperialibacter sp.]|uniref:tetratricopeptide repeat protein n=1 Tax=uncultured Imperialibacter sp. TaxID=1672639 RepID=UPI0030D84BC5|tara:strand:- start:395 stop:2059 length:1665 start_codon:yes stop_codon:yes gene_type:complete
MWCPVPEKSTSLFVVVFFISIHCLAQGITVDRLKEMVRAEEYEQVVTVASQLLENSKDPLEKARLYQLKADALYYVNNLPESLENYLLAIEAASKSEVSDLLLMLECNSHAGFCYRELGIYSKALDYYFNALDYAVSLQDSTELATAYYNVGSGYQSLGDFANAIDYTNRAYEIDRVKRDTSAIAFDLKQMGILSEENGNYNKAITHYKESILMHRKGGGNANSVAERMNSIGLAYQKLGIMDSALYYVEQSLKAHQALNDSINIAERWVNLASIYNQQKKYREARRLVELAMHYYEGMEESEHLSSARLTLAENFMLTGQFAQAEALLIENINFSKKNQLLIQLKESYRLLAKVKEYKSEYIEALDAFKQYKLLEDSTLTLFNRNAISELNIKYAVDVKEQENTILRLENEVQQSEIASQEVRERWLMVSLAIVVISLLSITLALMSRYKAKRLQLEAEVNEMRTKIKVVLDQDTQALNMELDDINQRLAQPLSEREFEILTHALSNLNNSEIAEKVFVSVNTVKYHLKNIYEKLGVTNRKEAMQFALSTPKD